MVHFISAWLAANYASTFPFGPCLWDNWAKGVLWLSYRTQRSSAASWRKLPWVWVSSGHTKSVFARVRALAFLHPTMNTDTVCLSPEMPYPRDWRILHPHLKIPSSQLWTPHERLRCQRESHARVLQLCVRSRPIARWMARAITWNVQDLAFPIQSRT